MSTNHIISQHPPTEIHHIDALSEAISYSWSYSSTSHKTPHFKSRWPTFSTFLLRHTVFYDADAMTSIRSMTCDQSSSHRDAPALNTMMQQQAASHWSTEGLQNQSQRSGVMSLDTVLSQQNKASAVFMWPFMWTMQTNWWPWVEISSVIKTECCQQLKSSRKRMKQTKTYQNRQWQNIKLF